MAPEYVRVKAGSRRCGWVGVVSVKYSVHYFAGKHMVGSYRVRFPDGHKASFDAQFVAPATEFEWQVCKELKRQLKEKHYERTD